MTPQNPHEIPWMPTVDAARLFFRGSSANSNVRAALARLMAGLIPPDAANILDVGCGDGKMAEFLQHFRPGTRVTATDMDRSLGLSADIPFVPSQPVRLPFADRSFDALVLFNVLHHAADPGALLAEARRVCRGAIIVKDHVRSGPLAVSALTVLDWLGNVPQGRSPRATYSSMAEWESLLQGETSRTIYPLRTGVRLYDALFAHLNVVFVLEPAG